MCRCETCTADPARRDYEPNELPGCSTPHFHHNSAFGRGQIFVRRFESGCAGMTPNGRIISMTKSAILMGILGFGLVLHAGSSVAQNTTTSNSASTANGSTASQG